MDSIIRLGSQPSAITVALSMPGDVPRAVARIIPYSLKQGGFAVSVPTNGEVDAELAVIDLRRGRPMDASRSLVASGLIARDAFLRSEIVHGPIKLSFHPSGFVQFSPAGRERFRSGVLSDPIVAARGFGMWWTAHWSHGELPGFDDAFGASFSVNVWGIAEFPEAKRAGVRRVEVFETAPPPEKILRAELSQEYLDWITDVDDFELGGETFALEGYVLPRSVLPYAQMKAGRIIIHAQPGHWSVARHLRILDWGDPFCVVAIHVGRRGYSPDGVGSALVGPVEHIGRSHLAAFVPPLQAESDAQSEALGGG